MRWANDTPCVSCAHTNGGRISKFLFWGIYSKKDLRWSLDEKVSTSSYDTKQVFPPNFSLFLPFFNERQCCCSFHWDQASQDSVEWRRRCLFKWDQVFQDSTKRRRRCLFYHFSKISCNGWATKSTLIKSRKISGSLNQVNFFFFFALFTLLFLWGSY